MVYVGLLISLIGMLVSFVASILLLMAVYRKSGIGWLLGSLLIPFVSLVWIVMNWEEGKSPFFKGLLGSALCVTGSVVMTIFGQ